MIHFDGFSWQFAGAAAWALRDVSLNIDRGEFVVIAGPSGSGKTTLALAMCGLLMGRYEGRVDGSVRVDGRDAAETPTHQIAQTIGLVQQNPETHFATLRVSDEIAFALENRCLTRDDIVLAVRNAMRMLSIDHLHDRDLASLSGGEKQRVAVASIVAGSPAVLVLDEPTASLDPRASRDLFRVLADLCRRTELTVVIIEHKLDHLLPLEPRLVALQDGRVVCDQANASSAASLPAFLAASEIRRPDIPQSPLSPRPDPPLVEVSDLAVELDSRLVLHDLSLRVQPGEMLAVLGPTGGGKTTLLYSLMGLAERAHGTVRVCGMEVSPRAVSRLARHVGFVFQNADHQLVADTVQREALFAPRRLGVMNDAVQAEADRLLERAGLGQQREDHPFRLSWGQKRRLNVISAVLHRPRLLLLDEPFAGQDWEHAAFLLEAVRAVLCGTLASASTSAETPSPGACLMVTHDMRVVARACTRVLFVENGRITLDAPLPEVFERLLSMRHDAYVPSEYRQHGAGPGAVKPQARTGADT
ncbi:MAG: ATP-binding cassette domain-containing protein [Phycisphaerales bacterium]|nr:MAG: ATP-binding cassette domain-containing protein [Phycisphaerales bacterium]